MRKVFFLIVILVLISCSDTSNTINSQVCKNTCNFLGELFCENGNVYSCNTDKNNCLMKELQKNCAFDEICRMGSCLKSQCEDECFSSGLNECQNNAVKICGNFDDDLCFETQINPCPSNTNCLNGICISSENPCQNISCSNHGECKTENNLPYCECDEGYIVNGFNCVEYISPCNNCKTWEECVNEECKPITGRCNFTSDCNPGFDCENTYCVEANLCRNISCGVNKHCEVLNNSTVCVCNENYTENEAGFCCENINCVLNSKICDGDIIRICSVSSDQCKKWNRSEDCSLSNNNETCGIVNNEYQCVCKEGYLNQNNICKPTCDVIDCSNHGNCDDSTGIAICNCTDINTTHYYGLNCENSCEHQCSEVGLKRCKPTDSGIIEICESDINGCNHWITEETCLFSNNEICDSQIASCVCLINYSLCDGNCVNLLTDRNNCGDCLNECFDNENCVEGDCIPSSCQDDRFESNDNLNQARNISNGIYTDLMFCKYLSNGSYISNDDWYKITGYNGTIRAAIIYEYLPEQQLTLDFIHYNGTVTETLFLTPINNGYAYVEYIIPTTNTQSDVYYLKVTGTHQSAYDLIIDNSNANPIPQTCYTNECVITSNEDVTKVDLFDFYSVESPDSSYLFTHCSDYDHNGCYSLRKDGGNGNTLIDHSLGCNSGTNDFKPGILGCINATCDNDSYEADDQTQELTFGSTDVIYIENLKTCSGSSDLYYFSTSSSEKYEITVEYSPTNGDLIMILYDATINASNSILYDISKYQLSTSYTYNYPQKMQYISSVYNTNNIKLLKITPVYRQNKSNNHTYKLRIKKSN